MTATGIVVGRDLRGPEPGSSCGARKQARHREVTRSHRALHLRQELGCGGSRVLSVGGAGREQGDRAVCVLSPSSRRQPWSKGLAEAAGVSLVVLQEECSRQRQSLCKGPEVGCAWHFQRRPVWRGKSDR